METKIILKGSLAVMMAVMFFFIAGCSKDPEDNPAVISGQRVIGAKMILLDTLEMNETFIYSGNLLSAIMMGETSFSDSNMYVIQYAVGKVSTGIYYSKSNGTWAIDSKDEILGYSGDLPTGIHSTYYDSTGTIDFEFKELYTYAGNLLMKIEDYINFSGNWVLLSNYTYSYDNLGRISQITDTATEWGYVSGYITTYLYEGDKLTESIEIYYSYTGADTSSRCVYQYANNHLSAKTYYHKDAGQWTVSSEWQYQYNADGNLEREWRTDGQWDYTYTYGPGTGNYASCMKTFSIQSILPGDPTPYPVKPVRNSQGPGFLSTNPGSFHQ